MGTSSSPVESLRGAALLDRPSLNKGTAFTADERTEHGLHGLLPPHIETLDEQVARAWDAFRYYEKDMSRHINLRTLQDTNDVLFYRLLLDHVEEMLPIVYTPVVAEACKNFSHIYRRPRGLFVPYPQRDSIAEMLRNRPHPDVDVIVVTDGERILGIGDQGAGGMGIPIGKLSLYTLIGGVHPARTLPILLDVGTNNEALLADPSYLGWRHPRITGDEYYAFVDQFVQAVKQELPSTLLQWEDFAGTHARPLLERYRDELLTFNDDIQGTAAVTLGAIMGAASVAGTRLRDQEIVFLGAGSASVGVADYLVQAMVDDGLTLQEARARIWMINRSGLLTTQTKGLSAEQQVYMQNPERVAGWATGEKIELADVIRNLRATALIGLSTNGGAFTEEIVREMASKVTRPIIFPLSNPTDKSEAIPSDLIAWTEGRALIATGSPFKPVEWNGKSYGIAQCNNVYIFPAIGLAASAARMRRVTDGMMIAAARALAAASPAMHDPEAPILPPIRKARETAIEIALAVVMQSAKESGMPVYPEQMRQAVAAHQWTPAYR